MLPDNPGHDAELEQWIQETATLVASALLARARARRLRELETLAAELDRRAEGAADAP